MFDDSATKWCKLTKLGFDGSEQSVAFVKQNPTNETTSERFTLRKSI